MVFYSPDHVLLFSFPAQGHVNPLLRLGKRLASKGMLVTFSTTEGVGKHMRNANDITDEPVPLGDGFIRFEFFEDGWEENDPRRQDLDQFLSQLELVGKQVIPQMAKKHSEQGHPVSCIISNPFIPGFLMRLQVLELEHDLIEYMSKLYNIMPVGPLFKDPNAPTTTIQGDFLKADDCIGWLDSKPLSSVVYVSLGSIVTLKQEQFNELAYGLLNSGVSFLWVFRPPPKIQSLNLLISQMGSWKKMCRGQAENKLITRDEVEKCLLEATVGPKAAELKQNALKWKAAAEAAVAEGGSSYRNINFCEGGEEKR
ncbi:hypothetical protein GH714_032898 [Hevea brasiliensis]|uniref:Anthocyanidin 3-O-glucosyltransferase n=1 Tax=Hevea brasiliensis TaxID=3981 RepID=A0A6A6N6F8_HEVBR|nr:hypothetical protein GH714_032898 [Hevea brasiliensis]